MINVIVELSKYIILTLMIVYTFHCFYTVRQPDEEERNELLRQQLILIFFIDFTAFLVIYLKTFDYKVVRFYIEMQIFFAVIQILYRVLYKKASLLLLNNMCMLLSVGFIMLCRLDITMATKQLLVAAGASAVALAIPVMIRTFVFFMASFLSRDTSLKAVVQVSAVAAFHVGILVLSRDLGSAVIFFVAYLVMVYVSTRNVGYLGLGLVGGSGAAVVAYHLFGHVRQRVSAWKDPMAVYQNEGYQIVQSLFAIGTGGWFGMGLCQGSPESIPVVKNDFIFSAICEELGGIFAICLILVCMSFFLMIVNIALRIINPFYKLIALGLGTEYAFQVFLTIGGATKFIPMTGVTLPLVSYGGSSLLSTILMLAIIQGLYILREDEDEEFEKRRKEALQRIRAREEIGERTRRI